MVKLLGELWTYACRPVETTSAEPVARALSCHPIHDISRHEWMANGSRSGWAARRLGEGIAVGISPSSRSSDTPVVCHRRLLWQGRGMPQRESRGISVLLSSAQ